MATKLEKLLFAIGVKDDGAGSKIGSLQKQIRGLTRSVDGHFKSIGAGAIGLVGSVMSLKGLAEPAIELNRALGEVGSLGVDNAALAELQKTAGSFAMKYGGVAADVVRSSYDIQSAIAGLAGKELAAFTQAGGVLAKATKAEVGTITSYLGTMYGIFEGEATRMGKAAWVDQVAGRTAYAVQIFKTSGAEMSAAFTSLGANAKAAGVDAAEQMAVLGMLQSTMSGSEAGSKYKAFLRGVGQAQKALGLNFTDSQGKMLGMGEILDKIRGKYGDTLTVAQSDAMKKAFGSDEAVGLINLMLSQTDALKGNIRDIAEIKGMANAERMAGRQSDAFQRFGGAVNYVQASFMQKLLPTLERWTDKATAKLEILGKWTDKYPNVTRVVGYLALAVAGLTGIVAIGSIVFHMMHLSAIALAGPLKLLTGGVKLAGSAFKLLSMIIRANPLGILITLLIACIVYWDDVSAAIGSVWSLLRDFFASLGPIGAPFLFLMDKIEERWRMMTGLFRDFSWTKLLKTAVSLALAPLELFVNGIGELLSYIPGMGDQAELMRNWKVSNLFDDEKDKMLPEQLALAGVPQTAFAASTGLGAMTARSGLESVRRAGVPQTAFAASTRIGASTERPVVDYLRQAGESPRIRDGSVATAFYPSMATTGKTMNIGEQHLHFENPPENRDDLAAMLLN